MGSDVEDFREGLNRLDGWMILERKKRDVGGAENEVGVGFTHSSILFVSSGDLCWLMDATCCLLRLLSCFSLECMDSLLGYLVHRPPPPLICYRTQQSAIDN